MSDDFDEKLLAHWCELYVRFVIRDSHRLANAVKNCRAKQLSKYRLENICDILSLLTKSKHENDDYLNAYGCLYALDKQFWGRPHQATLNGFIEVTLNGIRYILTHLTEHPITKAIPKDQRFKHDAEIGINNVLGLRYRWQELEFSTEIEISRSNVFDAWSEKSKTQLNIGFSPFADKDDMIWQHDPDDMRIDNSIPFWCAGAKDEAMLLKRLNIVLESAYQQQVHVLLFPELVMTKTLQTAISAWLREHNAFHPMIRLIIAGTRHVFDTNQANAYSNRCTVFNLIGDIEWEQEKRQPFQLDSKEANTFFSILTPAFEPTQLSERLVMRHTALGIMATPICLDFLCDKLWQAMPIAIFFIPAMSAGLASFMDRCRVLGKEHGSAAFVCNAQTNDPNAVLAYRPAKDTLTPQQQTPFLFTVEVDIDMNYNEDTQSIHIINPDKSEL